MNKMLMAIMAVVIIGGVVASEAQINDTKANISGTVIDNPGMLMRLPLPIENVTVRLWQLDIFNPWMMISNAVDSAITDSNGKFRFTGVSTDYYKLTFEHKDYVSAFIDITITCDTSVTVQMAEKNQYSGNQLIVTPPVPSSKDSIQFELFMSDHCCATVYRDHKVDVTNTSEVLNYTFTDTSVVLNYTFDDRLCPTVMCFTNISNTTFISKPMKAGTYKVYKCGQYYCPPGSACPTIYYPPVLVGTVTITNGTKTVHVESPKQSVPYVISKNKIQFNAVRNAHLSIDCFTLSGVYAGSLYNGVVGNDNASFSLAHPILNRLNQKTIVLRISINGVVRSELLKK